MNYVNRDFFHAWAQGGRHAYCYLSAARQWAVCARDYAAAAELDWLEDILNLKTAQEIAGVAA